MHTFQDHMGLYLWLFYIMSYVIKVNTTEEVVLELATSVYCEGVLSKTIFPSIQAIVEAPHSPSRTLSPP